MTRAGVFIRQADMQEIGALAQLDWPGMPPWPPAAWAGYLPGSDPGERQPSVLVAWSAEGLLCGWLAGVQVLAEAELEYLLVRPACRRQGVARSLLEFWLRSLEQGGAEEVFLEVRAGNREALHLYEAQGFEVTGVRKAYYVAPVEDALVMRRRLP